MEQKNRILIVEDDTDINNLLYTALQKAGYETVQAFSGTEARMLFQMDKALDCFWKAWKENHSEKAMKVYLLAYRSVHSEEEYRKRQEDLKTDEMVRQEIDQALKSFAGLPEQHIASGETDRILEDLTREYHRSTGS